MSKVGPRAVVVNGIIFGWGLALGDLSKLDIPIPAERVHLLVGAVVPKYCIAMTFIV